MPLLIQKTMDELMKTAMSRLAKTPITETSAGGIARLLLAVFNEQLASDAPDGQGFYKRLEVAHAQAFLSTAEGYSLDLIGQLLNCRRQSGESDDDFRYRISKQTLTLAAANATAIRLAALSVDGVSDVVMKPYTHGTGSGSLYIYTSDPTQAASLVEQVQAVVDDVAAYGVRVAVFAPNNVEVEVYVRLIFDKQASEADKKLVRAKATQALKDYINSRGPGEELVINEMIKQVMSASDLIYDAEIARFVIDGRPVVIANQMCSWNERFVEASKPDAVIAA